MKKFENKYRLKDHLNTHYPENNPYICKICDKGFTTSYVYRRHVTENHGDNDKMFACSKCENTYTAERNLMRHIESKHGDKSKHNCTLCEKQFERIDVLQKHLKYIHNIDHKKIVLPGFGNDDNYFECQNIQRKIQSEHAS